jgi:ABC-2 type transport system permease protein
VKLAISPLRIFFVGGLASYRALFGWLSPWILVPSFLIAPLFQILLFTYIGRAAHLESDQFYVIGNGIQYAAIPCLFAMGNTIAGERSQQTLALLIASPAPRLPLFLGRALPVIANGFGVALFALVVGGAMLGVHIGLSAAGPLLVATAASVVSCTGLGLFNAALGLRVRETAVTSNVIFGLMLIFCGVNVPLGDLPHWMSVVGQGLPMTHGIGAARRIADGASLGSVGGLLAAEVAIGAVYAAAGYALLRFFETQSRRLATLERV